MLDKRKVQNMLNIGIPKEKYFQNKTYMSELLKKSNQPGVVAHAFNSSTQEAEADL